LFAALYAAAVVVLLDQAAELFVSLTPVRVGDIRWRFGAFGLVVGRTTTAVLVDILVIVAALGLGHRGFLRAWAILHLIVAGVLLIGLGGFALDAIELHRLTNPEVTSSFELAAGRAAVVVGVAVVYCVWAAVATLRATRIAMPRPDEPLVVVQRPH
jgi:hypothetical protein